MKNIAIIFAGGIGSRMKNANKPKQFLELDGKPIIIHTIERFETCSMIDAISIACKEEYIDYMKELLLSFKIKKVKWLVPGGETGQLSIFNALDVVYKDEVVAKDAIVLIHDGVRPVIDERLILENIVTARSHRNAITVVNASETILVSRDRHNIDYLPKREDVYYARAPQTFFLRDIYALHLQEMENGNYNNIDSCSIMLKHGYTLNFVQGKSSNIKITTYEDYYIYKALYELEEKRKREELLT